MKNNFENLKNMQNDETVTVQDIIENREVLIDCIATLMDNYALLQQKYTALKEKYGVVEE